MFPDIIEIRENASRCYFGCPVPRVREFIISVAKRLLLIRQENESDGSVASIDLEIPGSAGDPYDSLLVSSDRTIRTDARTRTK
ncbi:unnamed protein product [Allacma fusca]|uniref:Uncharacterized protein n=1 Tax=Allacma fusca TaxID=39272 RepID=A0A8J2K9A5_9HEXA|nr:unnamed protein product [Allacma fusca]